MACILLGLNNLIFTPSLESFTQAKEHMQNESPESFEEIVFSSETLLKVKELEPTIEKNIFTKYLVSIILIFIAILLSWISIASSVKRFHDINKSGWWWWVNAIPIIGWIIAFSMNAFFKSKESGYASEKILMLKEERQDWLFIGASVLLIIPTFMNMLDIYSVNNQWYRTDFLFFTFDYFSQNILYFIIALLLLLSLNQTAVFGISTLQRIEAIKVLSYVYLGWLLVYGYFEISGDFYSSSQQLYYIHYGSIFIRYLMQILALLILIMNAKQEKIKSHCKEKVTVPPIQK